MQNKGHDAESAKNICGQMEQNARGGAAIEHFTDPNNNKLFVKAFLLDDSVNLNSWRVTKESINQNINRFIGKPLVLTEKFDHPMPQGSDTLDHWLAYQEPFRVGTIIDIATKPNPATQGTMYYAIIEITDDNVKQAIRDNKMPVYVSPAIGEAAGTGQHVKIQGKPIEFDEISDWEPAHLAIVDEPAYGVAKAAITSTCGGDKQTCLLQLRKAHVEKHGFGNCGFCTARAMKTLQILVTSRIARTDQKNIDSRMSELQPFDPHSSTTNPNANPKPDVASEKVEIHQAPQTKAPIQVTSNNDQQGLPQSYAEVVQENQRLRQANQLLEIKVKEQADAFETVSQQVAALNQKDRVREIASILTPDVIKDEKTRIEKINYFASTNIPIEHIEQLYKDIKVTLKRTASVNNNRPRVPYGASLGSGSVASSSGLVNVDEETGLTPLQKQLAVLRGGP